MSSIGSLALDDTGLHIEYHSDSASLSVHSDSDGDYSLSDGEFAVSAPIRQLGTTIDATLQPVTPSGFSLLLHLIVPNPVPAQTGEIPSITAAAILLWNLTGESAAQQGVQQRYKSMR